MNVRPNIKNVAVTKHFFRDLKNADKVQSIVRDVLDCTNAYFVELHKFEENIEGNMIFRGKKGRRAHSLLRRQEYADNILARFQEL